MADTVGFVDGKQTELSRRSEIVELAEETFLGDSFGGGVDDGEIVCLELLLHSSCLRPGLARVKEGRVHVGLFEAVHLILHQRDERAHHHRHSETGTVSHDGRNLIAKTLPPAGGHEDESTVARGDVLDDFALPAPKVLVTEHFLEDRQRGVHAPSVQFASHIHWPRPRSSGDRALASGARCAGSNPVEGA